MQYFLQQCRIACMFCIHTICVMTAQKTEFCINLMITIFTLIKPLYFKYCFNCIRGIILTNILKELEISQHLEETLAVFYSMTRSSVFINFIMRNFNASTGDNNFFSTSNVYQKYYLFLKQKFPSFFCFHILSVNRGSQTIVVVIVIGREALTSRLCILPLISLPFF